jgi:long-subunit fatty acid transport protein
MPRPFRSRATAVGCGLTALAAAITCPPGTARAGGYDTPMLYSARHMGMGGTAIGYVEDASALFHNPAGLGNVRRFSGIADFSLLLAKVRASPTSSQTDVWSERTVAPLFLLGAGLRVTDWLVAGLGIYPIASAGATYRYPDTGAEGDIENTTRLVFIEASPGLSLNLPGGVRLGFGYRLTYVNIERFQGNPAAAVPSTDFKLDGFNWVGFRAGLQWSPVRGLGLGAVYRHKVTTTVTNDTGRAYGTLFSDVQTRFVLPSKLGAGARYDLGNFGLALDGEYLFNSQNEGEPLEGLPPPTDFDPTPARLQVPNVFEWKNEVTVRAGLEYRLLRAPYHEKGRLALRVGYIHDGKTSNEVYPSAFGTPPGPTRVLTAGAGWNAGRWQINAAYAHRSGSGDVTEADLMAEGRRACTFCGAAGDRPYRMAIHGLYLDFSVALP